MNKSSILSTPLFTINHPIWAQAIRVCSLAFIALLPIVLEAQSSNVAKGKTAKQSSEKYGGAAALAVDGTTNGAWSGYSITHTADENNPWWEVDLGGVCDISEIKIWNRTDDCCWSRLQNFYVMVSEAPISVNSTTSNQYAAGPLSFGSAAEASKSLKKSAKGQYVRIFISGNMKRLCLAEVEVMGIPVATAPPPPNVAKGKTAKQSSVEYGGAAARAVDGTTNGAWSGGSITHTAEENNPWWEVDLGGVYNVSEIKIWNRTEDCCWDRLKNFYVMLSETPISVNSTTSNQYAAGPLSFGSAAEASKSLKKSAKGQYVRIFISGNMKRLCLAEVEVMGIPVATAPKTGSYVVEMLGKRGEMTFSDDISKKPTSAKIVLYGPSKQIQQEYQLSNCDWRNDKFTYSGKLNILGTEKQISLELKPANNNNNLLGRLVENNVPDPIFPVYATSFDLGQDRLPPQNNTAKKYDLVVLNVLQTFDGLWWINWPVNEVGTKFKMPFVTYDTKKICSGFTISRTIFWGRNWSTISGSPFLLKNLLLIRSQFVGT